MQFSRLKPTTRPQHYPTHIASHPQTPEDQSTPNHPRQPLCSISSTSSAPPLAVPKLPQRSRCWPAMTKPSAARYSRGRMWSRQSLICQVIPRLSRCAAFARGKRRNPHDEACACSTLPQEFRLTRIARYLQQSALHGFGVPDATRLEDELGKL